MVSVKVCYKGTNIEYSVGDKVHRFTINSFYRDPKNSKWRVKCTCECGVERDVLLYSLASGNTKSCGCYNRDLTIERNYVHGERPRDLDRPRLYDCWLGIHKRCENKNTKGYEDYGGRGIRVCTEWSEYINFKDWALNNGYTDSLTIDRVDVNGDYSPSNCRWVTKVEQARNKRNCHYITINGVTKTLSEWSRIYNISRGTILTRIKRGMSDVEAVTTPLKQF